MKFLYKSSRRICQKNIIVFKKKSISLFGFSLFSSDFKISRISNLVFWNWSFLWCFSNFFDYFRLHSFYSTFKLYNISNEKKKNDSSILFFELQCDYVKMWKCVNYKIWKICRGKKGLSTLNIFCNQMLYCRLLNQLSVSFTFNNFRLYWFRFLKMRFRSR